MMATAESLDQGLGAASAVLAVVFVLVLGIGAVMFARSRAGRAIVDRMRLRWAASRLGGMLGVSAPGEGARFAAEVRDSTEGEVKTNVMLSLDHEITPSGSLAVLVPHDLSGWVASNTQLAEGIVRAAADAAAVEAVVAVNAARFTRTGSHHADDVRAQARKRGSILHVDGVALYVGDVDAVVIAIGQSAKAAAANALRLVGHEGPAQLLPSASSAPRSAAAPVAAEMSAVSTSAASTRSARSAGSQPAETRSAGPLAKVTFMSGTGVDTVEVTTVDQVTIGRSRDCDLVIVGDLSVSAQHASVVLLPGGDCAELVAHGRTGTWTVDGNGASKHLGRGASTVVKLPAIVTLGDARASTVQISAM